MRTTITKKIMGLALSVFSLSASAQCPSILTSSVGANSNGGVFYYASSTSSTVNIMVTATNLSTNAQTYGYSNGVNNGTLQLPSNGVYNVCLALITDSLVYPTCPHLSSQVCNTVVVTGVPTNTGVICPTITSLGITYGANGMVNVTANYTGTLSGTGAFNPYVNGFMNSQITYTNFPYSNSGSAWFSNNGSGSFCVTYSDSNNNCYSSLCDSIVVTNAPNSGTTTSNCPSISYLTSSYGANGQVNITANYTGTLSNTGSFYSYENGSTGFGNNNSGSITYGNNGWYTPCVYYIDSVNNCWASACTTVNVTNATGTFSTGCFANADFFLFADSTNAGNYFAYNNSTGSGSLSYVWNFGDGTTSTQPYPFHQYTTAGIYTICLTITNTDSLGSCSDTYCMMGGFKVSSSALMGSLQVKAPITAGVKENNTVLATLNAFPNPMNDELTIEATLNNSSTALVYTIVDALGKVVAQNTMSGNKTSINTSSLEKGFYFLSVSTEKGQVLKSTKLVK